MWLARSWTTWAPLWQSQQLGQKGRDSAMSVNICLVGMIRSRASGPWLLADYGSEAEESCSFCWSIEVYNIGALREATYIRDIKSSGGVGGQSLGVFSKAEQRDQQRRGSGSGLPGSCG